MIFKQSAQTNAASGCQHCPPKTSSIQVVASRHSGTITGSGSLVCSQQPAFQERRHRSARSSIETVPDLDRPSGKQSPPGVAGGILATQVLQHASDWPRSSPVCAGTVLSVRLLRCFLSRSLDLSQSTSRLDKTHCERIFTSCVLKKLKPKSGRSRSRERRSR